MGDVKNLNDHEAVEKIKEMAKEIKACMLCTYKDGELQSRPMSSLHVDADGSIWFLSDKNSSKNKEIEKDGTVELLYAEGMQKYMALHGNAEISYDKTKIKELWTPIAKIWFTEGVDDPAISAIKFTFEKGQYWDSKHNKMIQLAKMAAALATGTTMDDGIRGKLKK